MGKLKLWTSQQDHILMAVSNATTSKKWKKASNQLKRQGHDRTDIECRQRYVNHLDPTVNKQSWTDSQLETLYIKYNQYGNKWFLIQKHLPGRTQTKIKNYFYGNIRYLLKIILKYLFGHTKTGFVNDIKTDVLLDMYEANNDFQGNNLIQKSIKKLRFRVNKKNCQQLIKGSPQIFETFAKDHLLQNQEQPFAKMEAQSQERSQSDQNMISQPIQRQVNATQVQVICLVNGVVNQKESQLAHLQKMAKLHLDWYRHYENAHNILLKECQKNDNVKI